MMGERIHLARRASGLSLRRVAERCGVSATAVSKWESGAVVPSSDRLLALSQALGVRTEFFFRPASVRLERLEYRKRASLSKGQQRRIEAGILDRAERLLEVLALYPEPPVPSFAVPPLPEARSLADVESIAEALRREWELGLDPISELTSVLEERGLFVFAVKVGADNKFDGLVCRAGPLPVIVVEAEWPGDRQRFTLAHELGHLVLGERIAPGLDLEKACNRFAGAFLAPVSAMRRLLGRRRSRLEIRELYDLKQEFGVSIAALLYRARDSDILSPAGFRQMMVLLARHGWRQHEPGEPIGAERPRLFEQLVYHALAEEMIGEPKAAELLGRSMTELRGDRLMERAAEAPGL